jgi:hypothetical protein
MNRDDAIASELSPRTTSWKARVLPRRSLRCCATPDMGWPSFSDPSRTTLAGSRFGAVEQWRAHALYFVTLTRSGRWQESSRESK